MIHRCSYTHTCSYSWWKSGVHQLRLVVYPYYLQGFSNIPGGCLGFFPSTVAFCRFSRTELHSHFQTSCVDDFLMNLEAGYYITIWILAKPSECFWKTLLYMAYDAGNHFLDSRWFRASTAPLSLHSLQRREILSSMNCSVFPCEKGAKNTVPNKTTRGISQRVCSLGACQSQVFGKPRKWGILQAFMEENGGFQAVDKDVSCLHPRKLIWQWKINHHFW